VYFAVKESFKFLINLAKKTMEVKIEPTWKYRLQGEFEKEYFIRLAEFVKEEYRLNIIYPPGSLIFNAFNLCPFQNVKAVIIGQDPYHGPGQAHGLCFSVREGVDFPPSLINIFKEIESDIGIKRPASGNLERWASQGVLLLNATLTVRAHLAGSHQKKGWEQFTDSAINILNAEKKNIVFFLWGAYAQKKGESIDRSKHLVLESVHPSPLSASRGFFGNKHFSRCNEYLLAHGIKPINWQ
jgi:uracil-DNA glycosylase